MQARRPCGCSHRAERARPIPTTFARLWGRGRGARRQCYRHRNESWPPASTHKSYRAIHRINKFLLYGDLQVATKTASAEATGTQAEQEVEDVPQDPQDLFDDRRPADPAYRERAEQPSSNASEAVPMIPNRFRPDMAPSPVMPNQGNARTGILARGRPTHSPGYRHSFTYSP